MDDPKVVVDTILDSEQKTKPLSIARYALMELLNSPFISQNQEFTALNIIPSAYIMTHDVADLKGYNSKNVQDLKDKALEWSETLEDMDALGPIVKEIQEKVMRLFKVAPNGTGESTSKKEEEAKQAMA